jgi:hypothetical protein
MKEHKEERSSFSVEKEAKRLSFVCGGNAHLRALGAEGKKVFWFFFSKKNPSFR